jgi:hypothetical protein
MVRNYGKVCGGLQGGLRNLLAFRVFMKYTEGHIIPLLIDLIYMRTCSYSSKWYQSTYLMTRKGGSWVEAAAQRETADVSVAMSCQRSRRDSDTIGFACLRLQISPSLYRKNKRGEYPTSITSSLVQ